VSEKCVKYRDPEAERIVVSILVNKKDRNAFLKNRIGYLSNFGKKLSSDAKNALLQIPDDMVNNVAREYDYNIRKFTGKAPVSMNGDGTPHCGSSTFGDFFCDS
jgi:hypothetical protein